jgi:hypothetical protein
MLQTRTLVIGGLIAGAIGATAVALFASSGPRQGRGELSGYQEIPTLSTPANGTLDVTIAQDGASLDYKLSYEGFETNVTQAHIHLGRPAFNGGIMVYLCTNLAPPAGVPEPPACPLLAGTVTGTLTAADVFGPAGQGITTNEFGEVVAALRAEAAYGNVHTTRFGGGEIRAQVTFHAQGAAIR